MIFFSCDLKVLRLLPGISTDWVNYRDTCQGILNLLPFNFGYDSIQTNFRNPQNEKKVGNPEKERN